MKDIRLIDVKKEILSKNKNLANELRDRLTQSKVHLVNLMSSPGSGKTSLILRTCEALKSRHRLAVIEADIDSVVDSEKVASQGIEVTQLKTGGFCHVNAGMVEKGLDSLDLGSFDLVFLENVGNLVCPAECDTGADINAMILSVPEGDDKPLKYPLIFTVCDALVVNKIDTLPYFDFKMESLYARVRLLNPKIKIFEVSCKTGQGVDAWCQWLEKRIEPSA